MPRPKKKNGRKDQEPSTLRQKLVLLYLNKENKRGNKLDENLPNLTRSDFTNRRNRLGFKIQTKYFNLRLRGRPESKPTLLDVSEEHVSEKIKGGASLFSDRMIKTGLESAEFHSMSEQDRVQGGWLCDC